MNDKLQYASMLDIPVNTCNITYKPIKKRKSVKKNPQNNEQIKRQIIDKVNNAPEQESIYNDNATPKAKTGFKLSVISIELIIIGVLIATIFLTNAFNPQSGLNAFFNNVFKSEQVAVVDERAYTDFAPVFNVSEGNEYVISNGVATMSNKGSVYSSVDGTIKSVTYNDSTKKYTVEIMHSDNFLSKIEGLDMVYTSAGEKAFNNIPIGYSLEGGSTTCFISGEGAIISNFEIIDNAVVWAV